ncbi:hypothetical protein EYR40_003409 [Pleurotus pulmonarius]|nr:hypothetical protein EYR40_003409 [Pleurotus pulmonarius]KAF4606136.1 hypothetical protein EYR38_000181 [Pleurotus pulmonarius]
MAISLQKTRGFLGLLGPIIDDIAQRALESLRGTDFSFTPTKTPYHITVASKEELRDVASPIDVSTIHVDAQQIHSAGVGGNQRSGVFFVVIIWAAGQQIRKQLGLPPKQFHVTLSATDDYDMDKGIDSLLADQMPDNPSLDFLDHLCFTLHVFQEFSKQQPFCLQLIRRWPNTHQGYLRLADATIRMEQHKLAMLSYACAFERAEEGKLREYCIKKLAECSKHTEWGHVFLTEEMSQIPDDAMASLLKPWSADLRSRLSEGNIFPTLCLLPRESLFIPVLDALHLHPGRKLPRFFRWLVPFQIAVMSTPKNEEDIISLASVYLGIRHVLTLTKETPLESSWFAGKNIRNTFLPIVNEHPPSIEQMDLVMRLVQDESNRPLLVHCGGGKGRAGTVAACYLAAYGFNPPNPTQTQPEMSAEAAVSSLRAIRPGSIETDRQKVFVSKWCSTIWKRQSVLPDLPSEPPPCDLEVEGTLDDTNDLFILVGLPGSGKSWFSRCLLARNAKGWTRISQDDTGSRASCEAAIGHAKPRVLLDRCNPDATDRKAWLALGSSWARSPVCIWFDYDHDLCTSRAQSRPNHPTLPPGSRVRNAVEQMRKMLVPPSLKEGFKAIAIVRSFAAADQLVRRLSPPVTIIKFPRTPHLLNLGAATDDDVHVDVATLSVTPDAHVVITEKIDGANMGFSLSEDGSKIVVQNRSHYVNSSTHEQFKKLGLWVERHENDLRHILERDPCFPERYILFGEWMYATHSIPYTNLPDRFLAFDLYDRSTGSFADTRSLADLVSGTSLSLVPTLHEGSMPSQAELRDMVQKPSMFYDGRVEGVYVKVEKFGKVVLRGKVVRGDFISGNEHWSRGNIRVNCTKTPDDYTN